MSIPIPVVSVTDMNINTITGQNKKIEGKVVLTKKVIFDVLDFTDPGAAVHDKVDELFGHKVSLQLISCVNVEYSENGLQGKLGKPAYLENWIWTETPLIEGDIAYKVTFDWEPEVGVPGAFLIRNNHHTEFNLKTVTLEDVPGVGLIHFDCNSWVYPTEKYTQDRVFFVNKTYLPSETPLALRNYRDLELVQLRGDGTGELKAWDRVYDYAYYNDLGDPDHGNPRPVLGGSSEYPYPRRGRTGRRPTRTDPNSESRLSCLESLKIYVPRDERFRHVKIADFIAYGLKAVVQNVRPVIDARCDATPNQFDSFEDVLNLYYGSIPIPKDIINAISGKIPFEIIKELFRSDGEQLFKYPVPQVINEDRSAWRTDEEFGREMLAGVNPVVIRGLKKFPPVSNLDPKVYGNHISTITKQHIEKNLDGLTVDEAIKNNKLFILDHHDAIMPYLRRINSSTGNQVYASRTLLFLKNDGTLKPLVIELSLPHPEGDQNGCISKVYTPAEHGVESSIWQLAKAYAAVDDSGYHQLISHWLNTHAVIEPFVIATNRQLSVLHPIYKLLHPHFRDTMYINALGRGILINADGVLERTVFPGKYAMEMSSAVYKDWVFPEQALPADLIKRGVAVKDENAPHGVRLLIEDYPYAVDGLKIWSAIKTWVEDYCHFYYKTDGMIQHDTELQSWWKDLVEKGHGDKKDETWWPKMQTLEDLIETCTIIIWIASALHAAVNFGQYPYAGYLPNRPTVSRRFMPESGTPEYEELKTNPDLAFLKTVTAQSQTLLGVSVIETLSRHSSEEVYLGKRDSQDWTTDKTALEAFKKFGDKLAKIEGGITSMNNDPNLKNRLGPVKVPYTLLFPTGETGLSGKGIPNSVSI